MPGNRSPKTVAIVTALVISLAIIFLSLVGVLAPAETAGTIPLTLLESVFGDVSTDFDSTAAELAEIRGLRQRNTELEQAVVDLQSEVTELREYRSDYDRLAELVKYTSRPDWRFVTADVIGRDTTGIQAIHINRGSRDGVEIGDPVVSDAGLVGRVTQVSATGAEVLLITDPNSSVNARVQASRDPGLVQGTISGDLVLAFLDTEAVVVPGDLVVSSGETQVFPADIIIGLVDSVALTDDELFREAAISSLVNFARLEIVLVITNFEPVDLSVFEEQPAQ